MKKITSVVFRSVYCWPLSWPLGCSNSQLGNRRGDCDYIFHSVGYWVGDANLGCPFWNCADCKDLLENQLYCPSNIFNESDYFFVSLSELTHKQQSSATSSLVLLVLRFGWLSHHVMKLSISPLCPKNSLYYTIFFFTENDSPWIIPTCQYVDKCHFSKQYAYFLSLKFLQSLHHIGKSGWTLM